MAYYLIEDPPPLNKKTIDCQSDKAWLLHLENEEMTVLAFISQENEFWEKPQQPEVVEKNNYYHYYQALLSSWNQKTNREISKEEATLIMFEAK